MPMSMGFGCSIPAMANTRTLADEKERTATLRVIPFFSCGAKLPILTAIAGAIIANAGVGNGDLIVYSMYVLGMVAAILSLLIMRSTTMRGETPPFIMELPAYHMPRFRNLLFHLWDKLKHYIEKAFTIIFVSCIVIWFLSNFSWNWEFLMQEIEVDGETVWANLRTDESILGGLGMLVTPIFTPLGFGSQLNGFGWVFVAAAMTGLIAKENVVATFGVLASCLMGGYFAGTEEGIAEVQAMITATGITIPALISFIAFNMTTIPCFAAVATAKGELAKGKFKWTLLFWVVASYIISIIVYAFGTMFATWSLWSILVSVAILIIASVAVVAIMLFNKRANGKSALKNKL